MRAMVAIGGAALIMAAFAPTSSAQKGKKPPKEPEPQYRLEMTIDDDASYNTGGTARCLYIKNTTQASRDAALAPANEGRILVMVNDSRYGLQAGLFVRDIGKIRRAWDELHVGGVVINDVPSFRVDHMPYGGVKDSGLGREGIKFAIEDLTEIRLLAIREP